MKAFTILEVMIVTLLTAVIVLTAMSVMQIVNQQFADYELEHRKALRLSEFQMLLETDFLLSQDVQAAGDAFEFQHSDHQVIYQIEPDFIVRTIMQKNIQRDTFYLIVRKVQSFFKQNIRETGGIDFLTLELYVDGNLLPMAFRKKYSAFDLMKMNYADKN